LSNLISQLVQQIARPDESVWVPRAQEPTIHMGVLTGVDLGRSTVSLQTNVPAMTQLSPVGWVESYSPVNQPATGDVVRMLHFGTSVLVLGRHVVPNSTVLLG
jgi:hypothetical protein